VVRDEDIGKHLYRPIKLNDRNGNPVDVSPAKVRTIIEMIDMCPESWGPRLIYEEIREAGRHDISEELVRIVMNAMQKAICPTEPSSESRGGLRLDRV
jgi:hypothetical protein